MMGANAAGNQGMSDVPLLLTISNEGASMTEERRFRLRKPRPRAETRQQEIEIRIWMARWRECNPYAANPSEPRKRRSKAETDSLVLEFIPGRMDLVKRDEI